MEISRKGIDLIKEFEGFSSTAYKCPAGKKTIGYGHVIDDEPFLDYVSDIEADFMLRKDLKCVETCLDSVIKVKLTQGMFDALCSLVYNWGAGNFSRSKGLKYLNKHCIKQAEAEFFSKSKGVVNIGGKFSKGLYRRRQAELKVWNDKT